MFRVFAIVLNTTNLVTQNFIQFMFIGIVSEHASDVTSSAVRVGALNAITQLLDAPQAQGVLRELLPAMGNLIHDKVEKVRLAVVQLLLKVKAIPNIKYYHIVPLEHLTARFIEEAKVRHPSKSIVAAALTSLMINSYFPENSNISANSTDLSSSRSSSNNKNTEPIRRALQFCTDEPEAAIVFYSHVSKYRSFASIVQLVIQLFRCLYASSKSEPKSHRNKTSVVTAAMKRRRHFSQTKAEDDDLSNAETTSPSPPIEVLATIAEVIRTLWESIGTKLQQNDKWNTFVMNEFSGPKFISIFTHYDNMAQSMSSGDDDTDTESLLIQEDCYRICSAIVSCAGRLPPASVISLASHIIKSIQHDIQFSMPYNTRTSNSTTYVSALMCNWDMTDQIVASFTWTIRSSLYKVISDAINPSLLGSPVAVMADSKKRRSGRSIISLKSRNVVDDGDTLAFPQLPTSVIVNVLNEIFVGADPGSASARDAILSSAKASDELAQLFQDGTKCMKRVLNPMESHALQVRYFDVKGNPSRPKSC